MDKKRMLGFDMPELVRVYEWERFLQRGVHRFYAACVDLAFDSLEPGFDVSRLPDLPWLMEQTPELRLAYMRGVHGLASAILHQLAEAMGIDLDSFAEEHRARTEFEARFRRSVPREGGDGEGG